jgi:uncharacterized 2Fe-2S/4Fe-4S cluster protein (DUF4445 family)
MSDKIWIELQPRGERFAVDRGTPLQDVLFEHGVEFPCGGQGQCKGCRVRVIGGTLPVTHKQEAMLTSAELADGWRLACCCEAEGDVVLDVGQWEETILADNTTFAFTPHEGLGIAIDVGTTTLVAQLLDRHTGRVLGVESRLNPQAAYGADVMSRVQYGVDPAGRDRLRDLIRSTIGEMVVNLLVGGAGTTETDRLDAGPAPLQEADHTPLNRVVLVGNTVMHHLFCGLDVTPLSAVPFETPNGGLQTFAAAELGWVLPGSPRVDFLPSLGSFVGSDILAGILATRLHESEQPACLVDLGTNGEIVVGNRERMLYASTAAGPAFEAARISMGMRATTGAISEVRIDTGTPVCHVLGGVSPRGLCGSGLVDGVAAGLDIGAILPTGRLADGRKQFVLAEPVQITQSDIRELQLAKAAIAAGIGLLVDQWGTNADGLAAIYIAGAFGNYINLASARRIGLLDWPTEKVRVAGNTALLGAKLALFTADGDLEYADLRRRLEHVTLANNPQFMDAYVEAMGF